MMRRAVPVLVATAGGIALLANFQTTPELAVPAGGQTLPSTTSTSPTTQPLEPGTAPPATTTPTTAAPTATRTIDGPDVPTRYGDVQVRITVSGTHLEDVQALVLPSDRSRSAQISQYAAPRLREEALQAQSAHIDVVSGASYTSDGYAQSLQGAIDAIGG
jgi:uncharacterized protein with FMN-binding domain